MLFFFYQQIIHNSLVILIYSHSLELRNQNLEHDYGQNLEYQDLNDKISHSHIPLTLYIEEFDKSLSCGVLALAELKLYNTLIRVREGRNVGEHI